MKDEPLGEKLDGEKKDNQQDNESSDAGEILDQINKGIYDPDKDGRENKALLEK